MDKVVAIVGQPNVGKSTLFNRLIKKRSAIVDFEEGITRDRKYDYVEWNAKRFLLVDTGGIIPEANDTINKAIKFQANIAIEESDLIIFLVDTKIGATTYDFEIAKILSRHREKVMLVANKVDNDKDNLEVYDFLQLGFGDPFPIAAIQGRNTGDFLDTLVDKLKPEDNFIEEEPDTVHVAIVGKPNVGKSSIVNRLIGEEKVIVSDIPGTTRDSTDSIIN
ncbi:MAG: GTPase, partial [Candidatus Cloacimonadota bacterium]|nr:GTPase [Candidatus Cloacimonadota bacterium]